MSKYNQKELLEIFEQNGVTVGPVLDISDLVEHPYIKDREILINLNTKVDGEIPMHNVFPRLSETGGKIKREAPQLGQDNNDILSEIGYSKNEISILEKSKII